MKKTYRIGCGAGFSSDRLPPAVDLVAQGELDTIILECIGERTLAFAHRDRQRDPSRGYNPYLERRMQALLPVCRATNTKIVTNMGVANPLAAAERTVEIAQQHGLSGLKIAVLLGDDVTDLMTPETTLWEGGTIADQGRRLVGANVYLGTDAMAPAMSADVVITGRIADPALVLAPLVHHFGWSLDNWHLMGAGTLSGHLLECGMQVSGGYFADPGFKDVHDLAGCGYPLAEIDADGNMTITKLESAGGLVSEATVKEQLLYEVHDPSAYLTPDVSADFSAVRIRETSPNRVRVEGASGHERPAMLKATVGFDGGLMAEAGVSYAGPGARARAELARDVLAERLRGLNAPLRLDLIGVDALHATAGTTPTETEPGDVRLRVAVRTDDPDVAELVLWETEAMLCCGPAGGGGFRRSISPSVVTAATSIPRDVVDTRIEWLTV